MTDPRTADGQPRHGLHPRSEDWYGVTIRGTDLSRRDLAGGVLLAEFHGADVDTSA